MKRQMGHWLLVVACVVGCGSRSAGPGPGQETAALGAEQATAMCVRLHEQGAACLEPFAELLLELRTTHDPRFAGMMNDPAQAEEIRKAVRQETLADGTGPIEQRTQRCTEYATNGPPVPSSDPATLESCYALADCQQRVTCMRPVLEQRFKDRAARAGH